MLLIGSKAHDMGRVGSDIDYIAYPEELIKFKEENASKIVLVKPTRNGETIFMTGFVPIEFDTSDTGQRLIDIVGHGVATPDVLLTLKLSHRYLRNSPHFLKTMNDIHFLRNTRHVVPDSLKDWMKERIKATYWYRHPSLNQTKSSFFSDAGIGYLYDHDTIHECVKTFTTPAFEMIKEDKAEVFCSKEKFFNSDEPLRLATVLEEAYTLSLERALIPFNFELDPYKSFTKALEKICTSISSGWWREYAWENYYQVLDLYRSDYVERFKKALAQGIIKPYKIEKAS
jgi:hypothetical protein